MCIRMASPGTTAQRRMSGIKRTIAAYSVPSTARRIALGAGGSAGIGLEFATRRAGEPAQVSLAGICAPLGKSERSSSRASSSITTPSRRTDLIPTKHRRPTVTGPMTSSPSSANLDRSGFLPPNSDGFSELIDDISGYLPCFLKFRFRRFSWSWSMFTSMPALADGFVVCQLTEPLPLCFGECKSLEHDCLASEVSDESFGNLIKVNKLVCWISHSRRIALR